MFQPQRSLPVLTFVLLALAMTASHAAQRPNVVLVVTDDQGYGDIAAHGNSMIRTPNLDTLHGESIRLTDFHVDPTCSPTRSALMSGRYSTRTGVWHTINGRSLMRAAELTMAEVFAANGYRTGMFGKWHLGDNYPHRPQDQGFEHVVWHHGGGVTQGPDYWGNDYFDDTYEVNGHWRKFEGYCTEVWFDQALEFIEDNQRDPFFVYLATNAPHGPYNVAESYSQPYTNAGVPGPMDNFYGMITNIDENVGRLRDRLAKLGLAENTLLIFMTDNGTAAGWAPGSKSGWKGFNAGMRATKGSEYDGGHRVPCFWYWPNGKLTGGQDVDQLSAHVDLLPTLVDLCGLKKPDGPELDGASLKPILYGDEKALRERTLIAHSQRIHIPEKWRKSAVMTDHWRLVNGKQLFDIEADPGQSNDLAAEHPQVVEQLRDAYESWWASLAEARQLTVRTSLGGPENPVRLMSHDWLTPQGQAPWHQNMVRSGKPQNGVWALHVDEPGTYEISLYRWAPEEPAPIRKNYLPVTQARIKLGELEAKRPVSADDEHVTFRVQLQPGSQDLQTWFETEDGRSGGAFFVMAEKVTDE